MRRDVDPKGMSLWPTGYGAFYSQPKEETKAATPAPAFGTHVSSSAPFGTSDDVTYGFWGARRDEHNIRETNVTSIRVHHAPGGSSNFSLGGGYGVEQKAEIAEKPVRYNPLWGDSSEPAARVAGKVGPAPGKENFMKMEVEEVQHSSPKKELS